MGGGNRSGPVEVAATLTAKGQRIDFEVETFIAGPAHTLRGEGFDASEDGTGRGTPLVPVVLRGHSDYGDGLPCLRDEGGDAGGGSEALIPSPCFAIQERAVSENPNAGPDGMGVGTDIAYTLEARTQVQAIAFDTTQITSKANRSNPKAGDPCRPLAASAHPPAIAFDARQSDVLIYGDRTGPIDTDGHSVGVAYGITADALDRQGEGAGGTAGERSGLGISEELSPTLKAKRPNAVATAWAVRRLVTDECARLQGFPDGWSRIAWRGKPAELCPDGPQYKTYGNSFAVPVVRWIGERIKAAMSVNSESSDAA